MSLEYDALAREYAARRTVHPEVLLRLLAGAALDEGSRVLEVGCGTGNYLRALARMTNCRVLGIDPSSAMLARACAADPGVDVREGTAETLDPATGPFDFVFSVDVVHHLVDRPEAWRRQLACLAPGGLVCTVTDSEDIIRHREPLAVFFPETVDVDLARYPAIATLRTEMAEAGFEELREEDVEFSYITTDVSPYRDRVYSCLRLIPDGAFARGIVLLEEAARDGIGCCHRYTLLWGRRPAVSA